MEGQGNQDELPVDTCDTLPSCRTFDHRLDNRIHQQPVNKKYRKKLKNGSPEITAVVLLKFEPRQANLCLRAFRHDKF